MTRTLLGKVALVTGAGTARGIGRAVALALAAQGAAVGCLDIDRESAHAAAAAVTRAGGKALALVADVSRERAVERAFSLLIRRFGRLDILVNNAGLVRFRPLTTLSVAEWERTLAVNLTGAFLCARTAAHHFIRQGAGGCIINIESISSTRAGEQKVPYCVSKAGLAMLTRGLALELGSHQIRVNGIAPGDIDTDIVRDAAIRRRFRGLDLTIGVPLGRRGQAADIAGAAVFLASDHASFITGASLTIDGGLTAGTQLPTAFKARNKSKKVTASL